VLDIVMGLLSPVQGGLLIDGVQITTQNCRAWQAHIAHVPQSIFLADATIAENIAFGLTQGRRLRPGQIPQEALEMIELVGLAGQADRYPHEISGGQQQRAAIARTLVQGAKLVLADEPIASLDPESSRKVMEILSTIQREDGRTVVVSLHQVDMAIRYCPRIIALNQGQVVYDGPSANLTPALLRDLYGMQADEFLSGGELLSSSPKQHPSPTLAWSNSVAQAA
jgi:ABC-type phosphate/phosphonate transport system ATPase subunit